MIFTVTLTTKFQNKTLFEIYKKIEGKFKKVMQGMPEDLSLTFPIDLVRVSDPDPYPDPDPHGSALI